MPFMLENLTSLSFLALMEIAGPLVLLGGLVYGTIVASRRKRSQRAAADNATRDLYRSADSEEKGQAHLKSAGLEDQNNTGEPQTEGYMATRSAGGPKGSRKSLDDHMTLSQQEQTPIHNDPGHVA